MENSTPQFPNQFHSIHALSRKLIPICWGVIFLIVVASVAASIFLSKPTSTPTFSPQMLIMEFGFPSLFLIGLLFLMARFFAGCCRYGLFSTVAVTSIRWIGALILASAVIKLAMLGYIVATNEAAAFYAALLTSSFASTITNLILSVFLLVLAKIIAVGGGFEKEAALTV